MLLSRPLTGVEMDSFSELPFSEQILKNLVAKGYEKPTAIQAQALPVILEKKDVVMQSHTGSGKTGAFGLPMIQSVMTDVPAVQFLVLVPTRELAYQVYSELTSLAVDTDVKIAAIYGGSSMSAQIDAIRNGAQIVIGTPGRIIDHLKRRTMSFSVVRGLILDEADKMLSMGFLPDVQLIFNYLPKRRQTVMSSATFPYTVERIIQTYMIEPVRISLSQEDMAPSEIESLYCVLNTNEKEQALLEFIEKEDPDLSMIFCNTKVEVKSVHHFLNNAGIPAEELSSELSQNARERSLDRLRKGIVRHMVCTDLAARGIDVPHLSHVFHFSASGDTETFIHRSGRTGRAGNAGKSISLVSTPDLANFRQALKVNDVEAEEIPRPTAEEILEARVKHDLEKLKAIDFAKDTDIREEFTMLAKALTPEQAQSLLPLLLEHFLRREQVVEADVPAVPPAEKETREESGSKEERGGRRGRRRGRGRDRDRDRDRDKDRDRGRRGRRGRDRKPENQDAETAEVAEKPEETAAAAETSPKETAKPTPAPAEEKPKSAEPAPEAAEAKPEKKRSDRPDRPDRRERPKREPRREREPRQERPPQRESASKSFSTVVVGLGRLDGFDEMDINNVLRRQGRARMEDIGEIFMKDHETFVNIGDQSLESVLQADGKGFKQYELYVKKSTKDFTKP
jgi:ATP-dependent RNA helicase DeaD